MNKKRTKAKNRMASDAWLGPGLGPALTGLLRRLRPPEEARRHFQTARLEILKGLRALLDARIERRSKPKGKGERIAVE